MYYDIDCFYVFKLKITNLNHLKLIHFSKVAHSVYVFSILIVNKSLIIVCVHICK
jgi:hypothetical protein